MHFATKNAIFIIVKQMPFINIGLKVIRPRPITGRRMPRFCKSDRVKILLDYYQ